MFILRADAVCDVCLDPYSEEKSPAVIRCGEYNPPSRSIARGRSRAASPAALHPTLEADRSQAMFSAGLHLTLSHTQPPPSDREPFERPCLFTLNTRSCPICRAFFTAAEMTRIHIDIQSPTSATSTSPVVQRSNEELDLEHQAVLTAKTCGSSPLSRPTPNNFTDQSLQGRCPANGHRPRSLKVVVKFHPLDQCTAPIHPCRGRSP
jgi:hypothetical protein